MNWSIIISIVPGVAALIAIALAILVFTRTRWSRLGRYSLERELMEREFYLRRITEREVMERGNTEQKTLAKIVEEKRRNFRTSRVSPFISLTKAKSQTSTTTHLRSQQLKVSSQRLPDRLPVRSKQAFLMHWNPNLAGRISANGLAPLSCLIHHYRGCSRDISEKE